MNVRNVSLLTLAVAACWAAAELLPASPADEAKKDEVPAVKKVVVKGLGPAKRERNPVEKPTVISNDKELVDAFPDGLVQEAIRKQVDLSKQQLVFFHWAGSGQDKLEPLVKKGDKGEQVLFNYTPGLTRDLRQHQQLYAVRKGLTWRVERNAGVRNN